MEGSSPTESNDYATPTNPCHVRTTENKLGQIATSRGQIRADRDNPPLSLRALSSSLTSTCKSQCLHPSLTYPRFIPAWGSAFTEPLKMVRVIMHWTPEASWSSTFTEPMKAIRAMLHWPHSLHLHHGHGANQDCRMTAKPRLRHHRQQQRRHGN